MIPTSVALLALATKPSVILILLDDAGYGDFGFNGHPTIRTPELDRFATESAKITQFYVSSPACTASRYSILTGRQPSKSGFGTWVLNPESKPYLKKTDTTLAEIFKQNGYRTALFGKWHLGSPNVANRFSPDSLPLAHGFDAYFGIPYSNDMMSPKFPPLPLMQSDGKGGYRIEGKDPDLHGITTRLTSRAIEFAKQKGPSFICLWHAQPHVPLTPGKTYTKSLREIYGNVMEEIDHETGRLLRSIDRKNTIVVFSSDNGPWILKGLEGGSAGLFRDGKGSTWEGGVREPMLISWPGHIQPQVSMSPMAAVDLMPTLTRLALGKARVVDGRDATPSLFGQSLPDMPIFLHGSSNQVMAVRLGRWKLHLQTSSQIGLKYFEDPMPLLFNVEIDPSETKNVATEHPDVVARLRALVVPTIADRVSS